MRKYFRLDSLKITNDFAANAYAAPLVPNKNLLNLNKGAPIKNGPFSVIGPGTGSGVATLVTASSELNVILAEGDHMMMAAKTETQVEVIKAISKGFSHISVEIILSEPGLNTGGIQGT